MSVVLSNENGKVLYAIVAMKKVRRQLVAETIYTHATTAGEARWNFAQDAAYRKYRIVAVAPAVGFHVEDNHGEVLRA